MNVTNHVLLSLVRDRLAADFRLSALPIDVTCSDGCVMLLGRVENQEQRRLAVELVSGMIGVREVTEELTVGMLLFRAP